MQKTIKTVIEKELKKKDWKPSMITEIAKRKGLSISHRNISRILNENHQPKRSTLKSIAEVLGIPDSELTDLSKNKKKDAFDKDNMLRYKRVRTGSEIYHLVKVKGLTISGAKKQLKVKDSEDATISLLSKLEKIKDELIFLKSKL